MLNYGDYAEYYGKGSHIRINEIFINSQLIQNFSMNSLQDGIIQQEHHQIFKDATSVHGNGMSAVI